MLYPVWGYLYDRYARSKLLSLASLIWGSTTALSAVAPNVKLFMLTRASTGIDDSSYPGLYSLLSDYFKPSSRGKVYGLMQMSGPFGFTLGFLLGTLLDPVIGWRNIFLVTGGLGILMSAIIFWGIQDQPRGASEPELSQIEELADYRLTWQNVKGLLKIKSLLFLIAHGFVGLFIFNVLIFWLFHYLKVERGYSPTGAMLLMLLVNGALVVGCLVGGNFGDQLFKTNPRGRMSLAGAGTFIGGGTLVTSFLLPANNASLFSVLMVVSGFFLAFITPNIVATMHDITLPEVRSTAQAFRQLLMDTGAAAAPYIAGLIAVRTSLHMAILTTSIVSWIIGTALVLLITLYVPRDVKRLRKQLQERAEQLLSKS
jgi:MFS family permease